MRSSTADEEGSSPGWSLRSSDANQDPHEVPDRAEARSRSARLGVEDPGIRSGTSWPSVPRASDPRSTATRPASRDATERTEFKPIVPPQPRRERCSHVLNQGSGTFAPATLAHLDGPSRGQIRPIDLNFYVRSSGFPDSSVQLVCPMAGIRPGPSKTCGANQFPLFQFGATSSQERLDPQRVYSTVNGGR